jgi:hypothetical protein
MYMYCMMWYDVVDDMLQCLRLDNIYTVVTKGQHIAHVIEQMDRCLYRWIDG